MYHKGVPTCRGIKNRCRRRGGKPFQPPLPAARHRGIKRSLHAVMFKNNGKRLTLLCGTGENCTPPLSTYAVTLITKIIIS